jgi:hypothetical protein
LVRQPFEQKYFCSNGCRTKFEADPVRYVDPGSAAAKADPVPEGTIVACGSTIIPQTGSLTR